MSEAAAVLERLCVLCGYAIPLDATKCPHCDAPEYQRHCAVCGENMPLHAKKCSKCMSYQTEHQCKTCGRNLPEKDKYCNECKSYQDGRRIFSASQPVLALLVALATVLTPLITKLYEFATRDSKTAIVFQSATADAITIIAVNTGRNRSILRRYSLVPLETGVLEPTELKIISDDVKGVAVVPAGDQVAIRLRPLSGMRADVPYEQISKTIERKKLKMQLEVVVEEFSGRETRTDKFPAEEIEVFILKQVPPATTQVQK